MARSQQWDHYSTGQGGIVVVNRSIIKMLWDEHNDILDNEFEKYPSFDAFEESPMYPFTEQSVGNISVREVLWDEDTATIVVIVDD